MTDSRKRAAIELREDGHSIRSIAKQLAASQSNVSLWVRGVTLTEEQSAKLRANTHSPDVVERRRLSRLKNELAKRNAVINSAKDAVGAVSQHELWLIGTALYWAEGGKSRSVVRFSNSDPKMIQLMIRFFKEICSVNQEKLRAHIHIHEHLDARSAEKYWQKVTGIPKEQFYKTYNKPNRSSKGVRNSLPYGVCDIYVLDAKLLLQIKGWIAGICGQVAT